ncbi:MAG: hypothetical protein ACTSQJ_00390 [Promethearchaeota archaeon]
MTKTIYLKSELLEILDKIRKAKKPVAKLSTLASFYIIQYLLNFPEELEDAFENIQKIIKKLEEMKNG